jgi:hypothetical protein
VQSLAADRYDRRGHSALDRICFYSESPVVRPSCLALQQAGIGGASWTVYMRLARLASLASGSLIFAAFLIFFTFLLGLGHAGVAYNSDSILPFLLVRDLLQDPSALFDWYPSPAFYVFPDWILAAVLVLGEVPGGAMSLFYGALLLTLYSLAGGALLAAEGRVPFLPATWCMAAALMMAGGGAFFFVDRTVSPAVFVMLASPHIHTGAVLERSCRQPP